MYSSKLTTIEQHFYKTLAEDICQDFDTGSLLDVGCGSGELLFHIRQLRSDMRLTGIDLFSDATYYSNQPIKKESKVPAEVAIKASQNKVQLISGNVMSIPFENRQFDQVVSTSTLHHFPDNERALAEMYRVLKPGGTVLIYDWRKEALYEEVQVTLEEWAENTMETLRPRVVEEWMDEYWHKYVSRAQITNIAEKSKFQAYKVEPFCIKQRSVLFKLTLKK